MVDFYVAEHEIMDYDFWDISRFGEHFHQSPEILYVLEGEGLLRVGEKEYRMGKEDFIIINSYERHDFEAKEKVLCACIHLNFNLAKRYVDLGAQTFDCNTTMEQNDTTNTCRLMLKRIFSQYFGKDGQGKIYLTCLYYALLNIISDKFLIQKNELELGREDRINKICHFIDNRYKEAISLNDLSSYLYLSREYLSSYFKKVLGMNFKDYLTRVRLRHAFNDIRKCREKGIIHIAMDNGFPNIAAFNKAFKDAYDMSPSTYLKLCQGEEQAAVAVPGKDPLELQRIKTYLNDYGTPGYLEEMERKYLGADAGKPRSYRKNWNRMINIGRASELLNRELQEHLLLLKNGLQYGYVRFWDLYAPELQLNLGAGDENYNFTKLDRILDFLVENGMKPYIELGWKPVQLIRILDEYLVKEERQNEFRTPEHFKSFLSRLIRHYGKRYGSGEVGSWHFELWSGGGTEIGKEGSSYFEFFEAACNALKSFSPSIQVGGAGFGQDQAMEEIRKKLQLWKAREVKPDFITLYCFPYSTKSMEQSRNAAEDPGLEATKGFSRKVRGLLEELGFGNLPLHVSEWNSTRSNRNSLHDACNKGAYMVHSLVDTLGSVDIIGYWCGSDLSFEYSDTSLALNGSTGLLTRDGIRKPAYFAVEFLNRLQDYTIGKGDYGVVTTDGEDNYLAVCHNYQNPNFKNVQEDTNQVAFLEQWQIFYDVDVKKMELEIRHVQNGTYRIKKQGINQDAGSVLDEWLRMEKPEVLSREEIQYLKSICIPRCSYSSCTVTDGTLSLQLVLQPQEIQLIDITLSKKEE